MPNNLAMAHLEATSEPDPLIRRRRLELLGMLGIITDQLQERVVGTISSKITTGDHNTLTEVEKDLTMLIRTLGKYATASILEFAHLDHPDERRTTQDTVCIHPSGLAFLREKNIIGPFVTEINDEELDTIINHLTEQLKDRQTRVARRTNNNLAERLQLKLEVWSSQQIGVREGNTYHAIYKWWKQVCETIRTEESPLISHEPTPPEQGPRRMILTVPDLPECASKEEMLKAASEKTAEKWQAKMGLNDKQRAALTGYLNPFSGRSMDPIVKYIIQQTQLGIARDEDFRDCFRNSIVRMDAGQRDLTLLALGMRHEDHRIQIRKTKHLRTAFRETGIGASLPEDERVLQLLGGLFYLFSSPIPPKAQ